jgi:phage host-nuclease inhibitor protein Gam
MIKEYDPAASSVKVKRLATELNNELARTAQPDINKILLLANELKDEANEVRAWAYRWRHPRDQV